jgi:hypothetical protein
LSLRWGKFATCVTAIIDSIEGAENCLLPVITNLFNKLYLKPENLSIPIISEKDFIGMIAKQHLKGAIAIGTLKEFQDPLNANLM